MQHSDNKDRTLKPMKNPFDDCDEVELHRIVIWHKKTSYFILRSTLINDALAGCNANNWPWPKALIGQQAAAALQRRRTGCSKTYPLLVLSWLPGRASSLHGDESLATFMNDLCTNGIITVPISLPGLLNRQKRTASICAIVISAY